MTRKRHIVIVDDEANIGRSLRLILEGGIPRQRVRLDDGIPGRAKPRGR